MTSSGFLLLNPALAFSQPGNHWAHQVNSSWWLVNPKDFHNVQRGHWRRLPYWIFLPTGLAVVGLVILIGYYPARMPMTWAIAPRSPPRAMYRSYPSHSMGLVKAQAMRLKLGRMCMEEMHLLAVDGHLGLRDTVECRFVYTQSWLPFQ
jgi:hypothetical protein